MLRLQNCPYSILNHILVEISSVLLSVHKRDERNITFGRKCEFDGRVPVVFTRRPADLFEKYANMEEGNNNIVLGRVSKWAIHDP